MSQVICYELNEVPWRVIDEYVADHPESNLATLVDEAASFTTRTPDRGHLSPWITWPTMHRGVSNAVHNIRFLGQPLDDSNHPPLWHYVLASGRSVGVFGALQSWPPPAKNRGFFVPDMFAGDDIAWPSELRAFQSMNLTLTQGSGRIVDGRVGIKAIAPALPALSALGVRPATLTESVGQVIREKLNGRYRYRRPTFQSILGFDVFLQQLKDKEPDYSSFFTNHVAGLMHRYWRARYPSEFPTSAPDEAWYAGAIEWGMHVADRQLGALMREAQAMKATLVVASSMGQAAVVPERDRRSLRLKEPERLLKHLGLGHTFSRLFAMEPQVPLRFESKSLASAVASALEAVTDHDGEALFSCEIAENVVSITTRRSHASIASGLVRAGNGTVPLDAIGLEVIHPETPGTAYHIPEGHLMFWGPGISAHWQRSQVSALRYAPTILALLGIPIPSHHEEPLDLRPSPRHIISAPHHGE